jgi:hypothetical protein
MTIEKINDVFLTRKIDDVFLAYKFVMCFWLDVFDLTDTSAHNMKFNCDKTGLNSSETPHGVVHL